MGLTEPASLSKTQIVLTDSILFRPSIKNPMTSNGLCRTWTTHMMSCMVYHCDTLKIGDLISYISKNPVSYRIMFVSVDMYSLLASNRP